MQRPQGGQHPALLQPLHSPRGHGERDLCISAWEDKEQTASLMAAFILLTDEMRAILPRCMSVGSVGMRGGEAPPTSLLKWQAGEMGTLISTCQCSPAVVEELQ